MKIVNQFYLITNLNFFLIFILLNFKLNSILKDKYFIVKYIKHKFIFFNYSLTEIISIIFLLFLDFYWKNINNFINRGDYFIGSKRPSGSLSINWYCGYFILISFTLYSFSILNARSTKYVLKNSVILFLFHRRFFRNFWRPFLFIRYCVCVKFKISRNIQSNRCYFWWG